jgi:acid phosphatase
MGLALLFCSIGALAQVPASSHVFLVVEENHSYSSVVGNSAMPYLNSLANKYGLATQYYANTHPSIGNYFMMTTGQIITNNDGYSQVVSVDNIVRHLLTAGKTWKSYAESLPSVGYTGGDSGNYTKHHNPFAYFSDVVNSSAEKLNLVPFTQFSTDLKNNQLPQYSFIVPNKCNDAHDCSLATADSWLKTNIAPLLSNAAFQQNGILVILFDESISSDTAHGGGHVATVVVSPKSKPAYKSSTFYQHQSVLRTAMTALGLTSFPGAASTAPSMGEFFGSSSTTPDFALSASPTSVTIVRGSGATYKITISPSGGFSGNVALSASGVPAHCTASFSPSVVASSGSSSFKVTTSKSQKGGTFPITITGISGGLKHSVSVSLTITR